MKKEDFIWELEYEIGCGIMSDSEYSEMPFINLFDSSRSDIEKICEYIKVEFKHAFNVIIDDDYRLRQFVPPRSKCVPNIYMKAHHVFDDDELQDFAYDLFQYLFVGTDSQYLQFLADYLNQCDKKLNDNDAYKYLLYLNARSREDYVEWFSTKEPKFISTSQVVKFLIGELKGNKPEQRISGVKKEK